MLRKFYFFQQFLDTHGSLQLIMLLKSSNIISFKEKMTIHTAHSKHQFMYIIMQGEIIEIKNKDNIENDNQFRKQLLIGQAFLDD